MKRTYRKEELLIGIIKIHSRGFGFVIPEERERYPEDIFIPRRAVKGAIDGDTVEVSVSLYPTSEKGPEGRVVKILRRGRSHAAGTVVHASKKKQIYAYLPLLGEDQLMRILPSSEHELKPGDRIVIRVLEWGSQRKESLGEMSAYIGPISDPSWDIIAAIEEFELTTEFPKSVLEEAKSFGRAVALKEIEAREDLRSLDCITIDPDTAKDFDDAVSLSVDTEGRFHLGVHIADVSHYVKPGTYLDNEASKRCNSVYFPGQVLPMLPHELSSHLCSLKPNVNRLAASILMTLDKEGNLLETRIVRSVIRSQKRFTYKEAKAVLDGTKKSKFSKKLKLMASLCYLLKQRRYERGSIEFSLPDLSMQLAKDGSIQTLELVEYDITHQLIEEFMLLANGTIAAHLCKKGKPLTYRIHEEPNPENIRDFAITASSVGFHISQTPSTKELQELFDEVRQNPLGQFLATAFIKSMKLASYSTQNIGHYGLGLEHYTHFTSPIRRYIDLIVHRVLFDEYAEGQDLDKVALDCSEKERLSAKAENSVIFLKKIRYLQNLKERGEELHDAVIVSIKPFGVFFELKQILFEGFLPPYAAKIGDKVKVRLLEVDLVTRQTLWELAKRKRKDLP